LGNFDKKFGRPSLLVTGNLEQPASLLLSNTYNFKSISLTGLPFESFFVEALYNIEKTLLSQYLLSYIYKKNLGRENDLLLSMKRPFLCCARIGLSIYFNFKFGNPASCRRKGKAIHSLRIRLTFIKDVFNSS